MKFYEFVLFMVIIVLFFVGSGYYHELQHQNIFNDYGIDSKIAIHWWGMTTTAEDYSLEKSDYRAMISSQEGVDTVKYNLAYIELVLTFIMFLLFVNFRESRECS